MLKEYVQSVSALLLEEKDPELVLTNLKKTLNRRGHQKLYPKILKEVYLLLTQNELKTKPVVTVRTQKDAEKLQNQIEVALKELDTPKQPQIMTDETLVGGFTATYQSKKLDRSYKRALIDMYRRLRA